MLSGEGLRIQKGKKKGGGGEEERGGGKVRAESRLSLHSLEQELKSIRNGEVRTALREVRHGQKKACHLKEKRGRDEKNKKKQKAKGGGPHKHKPTNHVQGSLLRLKGYDSAAGPLKCHQNRAPSGSRLPEKETISPFSGVQSESPLKECSRIFP